MSEPFSLRVVSDVGNYSSYYLSGIIILFFSTWLLYQQRSPLRLCHWKSDQPTNRYFNGASFFFFRGLSFITAGLVGQFCALQTTAYYVIWSLSIILHDLSLLYLITFIGPICMLKGWRFCFAYKESHYGKVPLMWLLTIISAIVCVLVVTIYDLLVFAKHAGIILESVILIYFFIYVMMDGCFRFIDYKLLRTVWVYVDYITLTWIGLFFLIMFDVNDDFYAANNINFILLYNIINLTAMCVLFGGILYENNVFQEIKSHTVAENTTNTTDTTNGGNLVPNVNEYKNLLIPEDLGYDSDTTVPSIEMHLDFGSSDMISLVDADA